MVHLDPLVLLVVLQVHLVSVRWETREAWIPVTMEVYFQVKWAVLLDPEKLVAVPDLEILRVSVHLDHRVQGVLGEVDPAGAYLA